MAKARHTNNFSSEVVAKINDLISLREKEWKDISEDEAIKRLQVVEADYRWCVGRVAELNIKKVEIIRSDETEQQRAKYERQRERDKAAGPKGKLSTRDKAIKQIMNLLSMSFADAETYCMTHMPGFDKKK